MSDSPNIQYATPDPEYVALFASLPPSNGNSNLDSVEAGRKFMDTLLTMRNKAMEPLLPDRVHPYSILSALMLTIIGRCVCRVEVQVNRPLGPRR